MTAEQREAHVSECPTCPAWVIRCAHQEDRADRLVLANNYDCARIAGIQSPEFFSALSALVPEYAVALGIPITFNEMPWLELGDELFYVSNDYDAALEAFHAAERELLESAS